MCSTQNILVFLGFLLCTAASENLPEELTKFSQHDRFTGDQEHYSHRRLHQNDAGLGVALVGAAKKGDVTGAQGLLDDGADPNYVSRDGKMTPLIIAATRDHVDVVRVLLNGGANPGLRTKVGTNALEFAVVRRSLKVAKALLVAGADPDEEDNQGLTPVHRACIEGDVAMVQALLDAGGSINRRTGGKTGGDAPLHIAAASGHLALVKLLLKLGADVGTQNSKYKQTALHHAASMDSKTLIEVLIKAGADVNHGDIDGDTPLYTAAYYGNQESLKVLVKSGAKRSIKNREGHTPRDALCQCQFTKKVSSRCKVELCKTPREMIELLNL